MAETDKNEMVFKISAYIQKVLNPTQIFDTDYDTRFGIRNAFKEQEDQIWGSTNKDCEEFSLKFMKYMR